MDKNLEKKRILVIEEATLKVKTLLMESVLELMGKEYIDTQFHVILKETKAKLMELEIDEEILQATLKALTYNFMYWYNQMIRRLKSIDNKDASLIVKAALNGLKGISYQEHTGGFTIAINGDVGAVANVKVTNLRELMTVYEEGGAGRYVDYVGQIKDALVDIRNDIANGTLSINDSLGRKKSIRNMAEIKTRYELINEDLNKLKTKGTEYVIATAHANASERCSWWQGKIFLIDLDIANREMGQYNGKPDIKPIGRIDGKPYYSLDAACKNGFLSYNCQHRVIAYYKGVKVPKYNLVDVKKRRDITSKQRYLERRIRHQKTLQAMAMTKEERQLAIDKSKALQKKYRAFCEENNVPRYDWRTRITEVERNTSPEFNK